MDDILLSVQNLKVYFRGDDQIARAVDGVSFDVRRGETVCLVGESGCGKTVSALSVMGLIPSPPGDIISGRILMEGQSLLDLAEEEMRTIRGNHIAMVFQEPLTSLNPVFTIGDQIGESIKIHEQIEPKALEQRCVRLLKEIGIPS
ncbi:MAG: ABC transporter ATP-binding protein, partial [Deltaproteobacteria bacterium]|nr:ABC transporter ATP-binding protein [Deltaproteobacteria bacterium]